MVSIQRFTETKRFFVLLSKSKFAGFERFNQFGIIDKQSIEQAGQKRELIEFLEQNCKDIKFELL